MAQKEKKGAEAPAKAPVKAQVKDSAKARVKATEKVQAKAPKKVLEKVSVKATGRSFKTSPYKLNQIAKMIRGKKVDIALNDLQFAPQKMARAVYKVLNSAISNAENNHGLDIDALVVSEAWTGKNLVMKRWRPRARGRTGRILKPFSQITIIVEEARDA